MLNNWQKNQLSSKVKYLVGQDVIMKIPKNKQTIIGILVNYANYPW